MPVEPKARQQTLDALEYTLCHIFLEDRRIKSYETTEEYLPMVAESAKENLMEDIQGKYEKLLNEYNTLRIENEELKSIPQQHGIAYPREDLFSNKTFPTVKLFRSEKITLFRSYFKGRDDVFARRWFSKTTEKSGYQPVCMNK